MDFVSLDYVTEDWRPKASKNYSVLLGPACSIAGGIPLSPGLLSYINKTYPQQVEHAKDRLYHSVMRALSGEQRLAVMQHFVSQGKLSWGYLALAQLIKQGLVSRVYSLNFDPLLEQACALVGVKPACYDCYENPDLQADELADQAIIYLHGQHTTAVCPDTEEKLSQYKQMLHGLFKRDTEERTWLVLGCSGLYDPVYEVLFEIDEYPNSLYWVGRETYSGHIHAGYYSRRVGEKSYFNFINNSANVEHDLVSLAQTLNCFSPEILLFAEQANFELMRINPLRLPGQSQYLEKGLLEYGLKLNKALESPSSLVTTQLILEQELYLELLHGKYQELIDRYQAMASPQNLSAKHRELLALAKFTIAMEWFLEYRLDVYIDDFERCRTILDQALALDENCYEARLKLAQLYLIKAQENKVDDERETEFETAIQQLRRIQKNIPDFWPALLCLAQLYFSRAKLAQGEQQTEDIQLSVETYRELIAMKADCAQAHAELADVFSFLAQSVSTTLQTSYFQHSARYYAQALELKDDDYEIWLKSGNLLQTWAKLEQGAIQLDLLKQSADKYGKAVAIKWDFSEAWHQWGNLLQFWAILLPEDQRQDLYEAGQSKYQLATKFNCELFDAWFAWGRLLQKWVELKPKSERIALFADAEKKFTIATRRYAEMPEAWELWSQLLLSWSQLESGERREELIKASAEKSDRFAKAKAQLCYQAGNEYGKRFRLSQSETDLDMALEMYSQATVLDNDHYQAWYWGARLLATNVLRKKTELTPDLIDEVNQWFEAAIRIKPDEYDVWTKWIDFLSSLAISASLDERNACFDICEQKISHFIDIRPNSSWAWMQWGELLYTRAKYDETEFKFELLKNGSAKFEQATSLSSDNYQAFYKWGDLLCFWADSQSGEKKYALLKQAEEVYVKAGENISCSNLGDFNWKQIFSSWMKNFSREKLLELFNETVRINSKLADLNGSLNGQLWYDLYKLGNFHLEWARLQSSDYQIEMYREAERYMSRGLDLKVDAEVLMCAHARVLCEWAELPQASDKAALFARSSASYAQAVKHAPEIAETWLNWGDVLRYWSKLETYNKSLELIQQSRQKYEHALALDTQLSSAWFGLAWLAYEQAKLEPAAKLTLMQEALEKISRATALKAHSAKYWYVWGDFLSAYAELLTESERDPVYRLATEKFAKACELDFSLYYVWRDWALLLMAWARSVTGTLRLQLFAEAKHKFIEAERHSQGSFNYGLYNYTCLAALTEEYSSARDLLEQAEREDKLPRLAQMNTDRDLDGLRQLPWFIELCQRLDS